MYIYAPVIKPLKCSFQSKTKGRIFLSAGSFLIAYMLFTQEDRSTHKALQRPYKMLLSSLYLIAETLCRLLWLVL